MKGDKTFWRKNYRFKGEVKPFEVFRTDFPLEIENFLSPRDCNLLISYYKNNPKQKTKSTADVFWSGRTVQLDDIVYNNIRTMVEDLHYRIVCATCRHYNEEYVYPEYSNLVYWGPNKELVPHCDNVHIDNPEKEHNTAQRDYSAVLCLNEDYEGGHTIFPEHDKEYPGKTGRLIIFPSGRSHPHGVTEVTSGSRYTFAMWMTKNNNYIYKVNKSKSQLLLVNEGGISLTKTWRWVIFFKRRFISFQFISPFFYIGKR